MRLKGNIFNFLFSVIIITEYLAAVLIDVNSRIFDIFIVGMILIVFVLANFDMRVSMGNVFFLFLAIALMAISHEISRISILCVYMLFSFRNRFDISTIKVCLVTSILCLSIIIFLYFLGFNQQYDTTIYRPLINQTVSRMSFGFNHPNQFMIYWFSIVCLIFIVTDKRKIHFLCLVFTAVFYYLTQSRTVMLIVIIMFALDLFFGKAKSIDNKWKSFKSLLFLFFISISVFLTLFFDGSIIDTVFSGRLTLNRGYLMEGVSLFGNISLEGAMFDNSLLHMLLTKGLVFFIAYSILMIYCLQTCKMSNNMLITFFGIMLLAFMEVVLLKYIYMLLLPLLCREERKKQNDSKKDSLLLVRRTPQTSNSKRMY